MFKHILLPTDGSELSRQAVTGGILLAKDCGASIVALHVVPVPHADLLEAWTHHDPQFAEHRQALFEKFADIYLSSVASSALAHQVPCECRKVAANEPYQAILEAAAQTGCDLIYMASHGWKGGAAQLLGSQTVKVLHYSSIPVLVHKPGRAAASRNISNEEAQ
jgi:nucleotide-binding universal stress UspA family protein